MAKRKSKKDPFARLEGLDAEVERQLLRMGILPLAQRVEMQQLRAEIFDAMASGSKRLPDLRKRQAALSDQQLRTVAEAMKAKPTSFKGPILMPDSARRRALKPSTKPNKDEDGIMRMAALTAPCPPTGLCLPMQLSFVDDGFNVTGQPLPVSQGVLGFGQSTGRGGSVSNFNEGIRNDELHLTWSATAPNDGNCTLEVTNPVVIADGTYTVTGDFWRPGADSSIVLFVQVVFSVNDLFLAFLSVPLVVDGTPDVTKFDNFFALLDLPQDITFPVQAGDTIEYTVSLIANTFSSNRGIVDMEVTTFGIPANGNEGVYFQICE